MAGATVTIQRQQGVGVVSLGSDSRDVRLAQLLADAILAIASDADSRVLLLDIPPGLLAESLLPIPVATPDGQSTLAGLLAQAAKPTMATISGDCLNGGLEIALACDIRVASADSRFGLTHLRRGLLPADGGTQRLTRLVGRGNALRMLLTGDLIDLRSALGMGLVQAKGPMAEALGLAEAMAAAAPIAAAYVKEAVLHGSDMPLAHGLRLEADLSFLLQSTADRAEGLRGFRERTPPEYQGD